MSSRDDRYPTGKHPDHKSEQKQEPVMSAEKVKVVELLGTGTYYPLCKLTDESTSTLCASIVVVCLTAIILLLIFTYCTLPILVNG